MNKEQKHLGFLDTRLVSYVVTEEVSTHTTELILDQ